MALIILFGLAGLFGLGVIAYVLIDNAIHKNRHHAS